MIDQLKEAVQSDYNQAIIIQLGDKEPAMSIYKSPSIYPITAISKNPKAVKEQADKGIVHITENGRGAYVFMGMQVFDDLIRREREDAAYEQYLHDEVGRGIADLEVGRYTTSREAMFARAAEIRARRPGGSDA
ncbi:Uncharacterised protein [Collinsella sp. AK_207A]|uniref:sodium:proline symporter n=1 Tax=Collinsella sp. AK_207A TaxID=2650472 RepID=UPI001260A859|nr:sodium:proline symporter [Collinsella sp. AK_207A]VWM03362.1 Uncharacterised protein [Collinsella sp. AK_207A]